MQCDNISASAGTSCTFASNTFYEYWQASGGDPTLSETINVWSADDQTYYTLGCNPTDGVIDCTDANGEDVRFSQDAIDGYSSSQASTYAASADLGPNG
ncbi:MAG: hypothetical protein ACLP66_07575 [Polyangia bacterium]